VSKTGDAAVTEASYRRDVIARPVPRDGGVAVSADGTRIAWSRYGQGDRTILFVPTWNMVDSRVVGHQVASLARHATVLTFDPRGAGASDRPARGYGFPMHAADAVAVLDANRIERASLVTASRGMNTVVLLASEDPHRFDRLVAIAPFVVLDHGNAADEDDSLESWREEWAGFVVPFMQAVFTEPDSADVIAEVTAIALQASPEVMITQELELDWLTPSRLLGSISNPTLLIHGDADAVTPPSVARQIADAMPDARVELIAGGGHRPDIRDPGLVDPLLKAFLLDAQERLAATG